MLFWVEREQQISSDGRDHGPWYVQAMAGYFAACGLWAWGSLCWLVIVRKYPISPNLAIFACVFMFAVVLFLVAYLLWLKNRFAALLMLVIPPAQLYNFSSLHPELPGFFQYDPHVEYFIHLPPLLIAVLVFNSGLAAAAVLLWRRRLLS